jgi:DNA-binding NarL/FixJ family response regulator
MRREGTQEERFITLGLIDSDPVRLAGFCSLLETYEDVLPTSLSIKETIFDLDVAILARSHMCNLAAVMQRLRTAQPDVRVIVSGSDRSDDAVLEALANGAKGYVDEAASIAEFVRAIRVVNQGLIWAPRRVMGLFIERCSKHRAALFSERITTREREVLGMLVAGRSNREIAGPLGIRERTVKAHVAKLMRKVGVHNRIALSVRALSEEL